jgi:tetratricopeptide (TPR) repeat protein
VHAESEVSFAKDYRSIADTFGMDSKLSGSDLLKAVRDRIQRETRWLLVVDNADNASLFGVGFESVSRDLIKKMATLEVAGCYSETADGKTAQTTRVNSKAESLRPYIPTGPGGTVLWTSRDEQIVGSLVGVRRGIHVGPMTEEEGQLLLSQTTGIDAWEEADHEFISQLLVEAQLVPLAVSHAGSYMRETSASIEEYLQKLQEQKRRWEVLGRTHFNRHRRDGVTNSPLETLDITIDYLLQNNEISYKILHIISYVDTQKIPWEILEAAATYPEKTNSNSDSDGGNEIRMAVKRLKDFSFLTELKSEKGKRSFEIHKLVQEGVRYRLHFGMARAPQGTQLREQELKRIPESSTGRNILGKTGRCFQQELPDMQVSVTEPPGHIEGYEKYCATSALHVMSNLFRWRGFKTSYDSSIYETYLTHAVRVTDFVELYGGEVLAANLLHRISIYLQQHGRWREQQRVCEMELRLRRKKLGERHPETLAAMLGYCVAISEQGRYREAVPLNLYILGILRSVLGEIHDETLLATHCLAVSVCRQGRYAEAEKIYLHLQELQQKTLGESHSCTLSTMHNLATTIHDQGRLHEAEMLYLRLLEHRHKVSGETHPDTLITRLSLGVLMDQLNRYTEAETQYVRVLEVQRKVLGETHPDTLSTTYNLGVSLSHQGRFTEAEEIFVCLGVLEREILGESHPDTLSHSLSPAYVYSKTGRSGQAIKLQLRIIQQQQQILGEDHPNTLTSLWSLAKVYVGMGRYSEAVDIQQKVLSLQEQVLGEAHPHTVETKNDLARALEAMRQAVKEKSTIGWPTSIFGMEFRAIMAKIKEISTSTQTSTPETSMRE